jgi:hypothetical protein
MIDANGSITPTLFSLNQVSENTEGSWIVMTLEYLNNLGFSDLLYLNDQKQISRVIIKQNREYNLERTDIESITVEFPEMAGDILRRNEFLKNNVF